jgi:hypothetical protein
VVGKLHRNWVALLQYNIKRSCKLKKLRPFLEAKRATGFAGFGREFMAAAHPSGFRVLLELCPQRARFFHSSRTSWGVIEPRSKRARYFGGKPRWLHCHSMSNRENPYANTYRTCWNLPVTVGRGVLLRYAVPSTYQPLMIRTTAVAFLIGLLRCARSFYQDRRALHDSPDSE